MNKKNHLGDETSWIEALNYIEDNKDNIDLKIKLKKKTHQLGKERPKKREIKYRFV